MTGSSQNTAPARCEDETTGVPVSCGGVIHTARVEQQRLVPEDHDVDAEIAIEALGGEAAACTLLAETWGTNFVDPRNPRTLLAIGARTLLSVEAFEQTRSVYRARARGALAALVEVASTGPSLHVAIRDVPLLTSQAIAFDLLVDQPVELRSARFSVLIDYLGDRWDDAECRQVQTPAFELLVHRAMTRAGAGHRRVIIAGPTEPFADDAAEVRAPLPWIRDELASELNG